VHHVGQFGGWSLRAADNLLLPHVPRLGAREDSPMGGHWLAYVLLCSQIPIVCIFH
jgi:hypothetical protein